MLLHALQHYCEVLPACNSSAHSLRHSRLVSSVDVPACQHLCMRTLLMHLLLWLLVLAHLDAELPECLHLCFLAFCLSLLTVLPAHLLVAVCTLLSWFRMKNGIRLQ